MKRSAYLSNQLRAALRRCRWDAATIARRAEVSRDEMARLLRGDASVELASLWAVADELGLNLQLDAAPIHERSVGPVPTIVDLAIGRLRASAIRV